MRNKLFILLVFILTACNSSKLPKGIVIDKKHIQTPPVFMMLDGRYIPVQSDTYLMLIKNEGQWWYEVKKKDYYRYNINDTIK